MVYIEPITQLCRNVFVIRYDIRFRKLCLDYDVMIDRDCLRYDIYSKFKSLYRLWSVCPICLYSYCISTYVVHKRHIQGLYGKVFQSVTRRFRDTLQLLQFWQGRLNQ